VLAARPPQSGGGSHVCAPQCQVVPGGILFKVLQEQLDALISKANEANGKRKPLRRMVGNVRKRARWPCYCRSRRPAMMTEAMSVLEPIIPLPAVIHPVTRVRSTLILSSINQLRAAGHFDAYERRLPLAERSTILETVAPTWLDIATAEAHYQACDELGLEPAELLKLGQQVGMSLNKTLVGTLARVAQMSGVTPWQFFGQLERLWTRAFQGGAISVMRVGPKEALIDVRKLSLCQHAYFRHGFCGVLTSTASLVASRATNVIVDSDSAAERLVVRGTWE
jgi:hypothetical protein